MKEKPKAKHSHRKLIRGRFINDFEDTIIDPVTGQTDSTYRRWISIIDRWSKGLADVAEEWNHYSNFHNWFSEQFEIYGWYAEGKWAIDKDYLSPKDTPIYSPETCVFIPEALNSVRLLGRSSNNLPCGVHYDNAKKGYRAQFHDRGAKKLRKLGRFENPLEAHKIWQHNVSNNLLQLKHEFPYVDPRVLDKIECCALGIMVDLSLGRESVDIWYK